MAVSASQGIKMREPGEFSRWAPLAIVGVCATLFLAGVYGYSLLFPSIEASRVTHFQRNVAEAMAAGNLDKALKIAHRATQVYQPSWLSGKYQDPLPFAVYGSLLLQAGREDEALEQLEKALSIRTDPLPPFQDTRKPYYFAPARMTLGKYFLSRDQPVEAIEDFELARAYSSSQDKPTGEENAAFYQAYATLGLWGRALEYGEPSDAELGGLTPQDINCIARICEGKQNWVLAGRLAEHLIGREELAAEGHYLRGRSNLARGQYKESLADLAPAAADSHACASFFLGTALEKNGQVKEAIQAYLAVPSADPYRPFALAKASLLIANLPNDENNEATHGHASFLGELDQSLADMQLLTRPVPFDTYFRFKPIAVTTQEGSASLGAHFPVLILWEDMKAPPSDPGPVSYVKTGKGDSVLLMRRGNLLLQLQWVDNLVNWAVIDRLPAGPGPIPGWIDTARDWFKLRPNYAMEVQKEENGNARLAITRLTWFYSVPVPTKPEAGYLVLGRMAGMQGKGSLGWQALETHERVVAEQLLPGDIAPNEWTWQMGYAKSQLVWDSIRIQFNVMPHAGTISFDDVMLLEIEEPDPAD